MTCEFTTKNGITYLLDEADQALGNYSWGLNSVGYLRRTAYYNGNAGGFKTVLLHRLVAGATNPKQVVDHINGNKYDNRRSNLRICTQAENQANRHKMKKNKTSQYFGVSKKVERRWTTQKVSWKAQIVKDGKLLAKSFRTEIEAAIWRDEMVKKLHDKYGILNFPE